MSSQAYPGACDGQDVPILGACTGPRYPIVVADRTVPGKPRSLIVQGPALSKVMAVSQPPAPQVDAALRQVDKPAKRPFSGKMEIAILTLDV